MARPTVRQLRRETEELLKLAGFYKRYQELEKKIKNDMVQLKFHECKIENLGRVFISQSERVTVSPEVAVSVLGDSLANKVIVVKRSVSNEIVKAFVSAGEINESQREQLLEKANRSSVTSLYVRPLT